MPKKSDFQKGYEQAAAELIAAMGNEKFFRHWDLSEATITDICDAINGRESKYEQNHTDDDQCDNSIEHRL